VTVPIMGAADLAAHGYVSAPSAPKPDAVAPEAPPEQAA
jgi:hypothetical protein